MVPQEFRTQDPYPYELREHSWNHYTLFHALVRSFWDVKRSAPQANKWSVDSETHLVLLITVIAVMAATMALAGVASADPTNPKAHPRCFGISESADQSGPEPGQKLASPTATTLAHANATPVAAQLVPPLQNATHTDCQGP